MKTHVVIFLTFSEAARAGVTAAAKVASHADVLRGGTRAMGLVWNKSLWYSLVCILRVIPTYKLSKNIL